MSDNGMEKPTTSSNLKKKKKKSAKASGEKVKIGKSKKSQAQESEDPNKAQPGSTAAEFSDEEDFRCAAATPTILSDEETADAQAQKDGSPKAMDDALLREQTKELLGIGSSSDNEYEDFNNEEEVEDYSDPAASPDHPIVKTNARGNQPASFNDAVTDTEEDFHKVLAKHEREMREDSPIDWEAQDFRAPATPQKVAPDNPPMGLSEDEDQDFRCSVLTPGARSEENLLTRESAQAQVLANGDEPAAKEEQVDDGQAEEQAVEANEPDEALLREQTKELLGIGQSSDNEYEDISNDGEAEEEDYPNVVEASPDSPKIEKDLEMNEAEVYKMMNGLPPALLATIAPSHPNVLAAANAEAEKPPTPPPANVENDMKIDDAEVDKILGRFPREVLAKIAPSHPSMQAAAQENTVGEQSTSSLVKKEVPIKRYSNEEIEKVRKSRTSDEWLGYLWTNHGKHWAINKYPFELDSALRCSYSDRLRVQRKREEESRRYYAANSANSSRQMPAPVMAVANPQQSTKERPKYVRPGQQQSKPARPNYVRPGAQNMSGLAVDRNENRDSYESTSSTVRQNNFAQRGGKVAQKKTEVIKFCPVEKPDWTESEEDVEDLEGNEIKIQYVRSSSSTGTKEKETATKSSGAEQQKKSAPAGSDAEYESAEEGYTPPEDFPELMTFQAMQEHVNQFCALHKHTLQNYFREINKGIKKLNLLE